MSIEVPAAHFVPGVASQRELKETRSDYIDAFNRVDAAVRAKIIELKAKPQTLLGQNVETLRRIAANPQYSKADKIRIDSLLDQLAPLQALRCDVVHGTMELVVIDCITFAFFANVQNQPAIGRKGLMLTLSDLRERVTELLSLRDGFTA